MSGHKITSRAHGRTAGSTRYFTGKPCKHGHITQRFVSSGQCLTCSAGYLKSWKSRHPEETRAHFQRWVNKNRDAKREMDRGYYRNNPDRTKNNAARWRTSNPEAKRAISHNYRSRMRGAEGKFSKADIDRIRKQQRGCCAEPTCRKKLTKDIEQIDHIIPLAKNGTNWPRNLQLMCRNCNASKQAADETDYAKRHQRFI